MKTLEMLQKCITKASISQFFVFKTLDAPPWHDLIGTKPSFSAQQRLKLHFNLIPLFIYLLLSYICVSITFFACGALARIFIAITYNKNDKSVAANILLRYVTTHTSQQKKRHNKRTQRIRAIVTWILLCFVWIKQIINVKLIPL